MQMQEQFEESEVTLEKKVNEFEHIVTKMRKEIKEDEALELQCEKEEKYYRRLIYYELGAQQELKVKCQSIEIEVVNIQESYLEICNLLESYRIELADNRRLYNELQDLKGNIRVYVRIKPFRPRQEQKLTTIQYNSDNRKLVIGNPSKQGNDNHQLFKFNKVFGPTATQDDVFLDTQPIIRSILDGFNVCIFAYGPNGSGKTYTMVNELEYIVTKTRKEKKEDEALELQSETIQELKVKSQSIEIEVVKIQESYLEECNLLESYDMEFTDNRRLYNEFQDLKGVMLVYVQIRPFLLGQEQKLTTIQYIGDNRELVVGNPSKLGNDNHQLFKFNKVFGPTATQDDVFLDIQPLIWSILDGFNELKVKSQFIEIEVVKIQERYLEKCNLFGAIFEQFAESYGMEFADNRRLYNELQDLKDDVFLDTQPLIRSILDGFNNIFISVDLHTLRVFTTSKPEKQVAPDANMHPVTSTADVMKLMTIGLKNKTIGIEDDVFLDIQPLIWSILDGFNTEPDASFKEDWGFNYRALNGLFDISQNMRSTINTNVKVEMIESIFVSVDLHTRRVCTISKPEKQVVPDASMHLVTSTADFMKIDDNWIKEQGYSILTVNIECCNKYENNEDRKVLRGGLHLIDLAGTEKLDRTKAIGDRLRETVHINKSLSALRDVFSALAQKGHLVPYRNSQLTLIQRSLGGRAKTIMFVHVNPKVKSQSIEIEVVKIQESYLEECNLLESYHMELADNRRLYNELQDLKVYVRIRPFLPGQEQKLTTIQYVGNNKEIVVGNPFKQGNDNHQLFKFNKVFGPTATQDNWIKEQGYSILTVNVENYNKYESKEDRKVLHGGLYLIDLAGSERLDRSKATGDRLRETVHINKSLSTLRDVFSALAQKSGRAKTVMSVHVNPDVNSYLKTRNTLKFAERVSGVELGAAVAEHVNEKEKG
ncbi:hypothetical protein HHK36_020994 [Tetracentron sinense]|uniref:Kinesin motor domain-containing protein n=1 Tax=Tetracentron sinense TaxID=13715 RepID=A0A834YSJ6_TETSI|nr:hypothetical protein HHK36_020994 [Tetracentron sinense]